MDQSRPFLELPHMDIQWGVDDRWEQMANRLNEQRVCRPRRIVVDRMDPFQAMTEEESVERFRLHKNIVQNLINDLEHQLVTTVDWRGKSILTCVKQTCENHTIIAK